MCRNGMDKKLKYVVTVMVVCLLISAIAAACSESNTKTSETVTSAPVDITSASVDATLASTNATSAASEATTAMQITAEQSTEAPTEPAMTRGPNGELSEEAKQNIIETAEGFLNNIVNGEYKECEKLFDDTMKVELPEESLAQAWNSVAMKVGGFEAIVRSDYAYSDGYDIVLVTSNHTSGGVASTIVFSFDKKVAGLFFKDTEKTDISGGDNLGISGQAGALPPNTVTEESVTIGNDPRYLL